MKTFKFPNQSPREIGHVQLRWMVERKLAVLSAALTREFGLAFGAYTRKTLVQSRTI
jgi:hypothetical protein